MRCSKDKILAVALDNIVERTNDCENCNVIVMCMITVTQWPLL